MIRTSWTRVASIEETLAFWATSLREIKKRIRPLFKQDRVAANAGFFLEGLLGDEQRKTGWMRAEAAGDPGPWRQQAILGRSDWDADALRDIVRDYVIEHLADDDAVLVIDETGFLKLGKASCGVGRQYTGSAGKITNCQIGVFAAYVSRPGPPRPGAVSAEGLDRRPGADGAGACAQRHGLCNQAWARRQDDRADDRGRRAVRLGRGRQRLRGRRYRDGIAARWQGLCAWGQFQSRLSTNRPPLVLLAE